MKRILASTVIVSGLLAFVSASNAALILTGGSAPTPLPISGNDFNGDLQSLGYTDMTTGAQLSVDQAGSVTFTYIGAESGFTNTFNTSSGSMTGDNEAFNFNGYGSSLTINVSAGDVLNFNFTSDGGVSALSPVDNNGTGTNLVGLGIFTIGNPLEVDDFVSPLQVVLGYDDQLYINDDDDDHDDMLIRVNFSRVPVPAAVWLFVSGFIGLVGFARRKKV